MKKTWNGFYFANRTLKAAIVTLTLSSASLGIAATPISSNSKPTLTLPQIMHKAAYEFPSALARGKEIEATKNEKKAAVLDSLSVTAAIGASRSRGSVAMSGSSMYPGMPEMRFRTRDVSRRQSVGISLMLSLETWFQVKGISLTKEMQESALLAMRMQLATDAASALMHLYNVDERIFHLRKFIKSLEEIQTGKIKLSPLNKGLLDGKINQLKVDLRSSLAEKESARAKVESFINSQNFAMSIAESGPDSDVTTWSGLPWSEIDEMFPVPLSVEDAVRNSEKSPALIQAQVSQKQARNQWYLAAARYTPHIVFSFDRMRTTSESTPLSGNQAIASNQFSIHTSVNLGGGAYHHLRANSILEEAAQFDREATERGIKSGLGELYPTLGSTREDLKDTEEFLKMSLPILEKNRPKTEKQVEEYVNLITSVDMALSKTSAQLTSYLLTRIRIHGMMGTLLEELERMEKTGKW